MAQPEDDDDHGSEVAAFIQGQLAFEQARQDSLTSRAGAALTGTTGVVTLVLAVGAYFVGNKASGIALVVLSLAVGALLASAVCAVVANLPWRAAVIDTHSMREILTERWPAQEFTAQVSAANVESIERLRVGSDNKARWLLFAVVWQAIALGALLLCALIVFTGPAKRSDPPAQIVQQLFGPGCPGSCSVATTVVPQPPLTQVPLPPETTGVVPRHPQPTSDEPPVVNGKG
ncbi:hypothetical protein [Mycolicibacterium sphagni]|uniref:Uncharacterized protein n=1 Tax=Mycolicibacterium sphagni TaxID=1786 RepID=A0A255DPK1_9MYCO|nr:hypothetical protein [Mycolicibacterium sphagni]OYN78902.1 hypothetical protein CG716_13620 [Mycolicibacterium sphagni]